MVPVTRDQFDATSCDLALREATQSQTITRAWCAVVVDVLSRQVVGVECQVAPFDQPSLTRVLHRLGKVPNPKKRRS